MTDPTTRVFNVKPGSTMPVETVRFCPDGRVLLMQPMTGPEMLETLITALTANTQQLAGSR